MPNKLTVRAVVFAVIVGVMTAEYAAPAEPVQFDTEVMAVLSKAGCNQGSCHGNLNGKGGFKLSLRGEDPIWDYAALTRDGAGRRISLLQPHASLILQKASAAIPHEGGRRFETGSPEYEILRKWIGQGARPTSEFAAVVTSITVDPAEQIVRDPDDQVPIQVKARFSDGTERQVTHLAAFEVTNPSVASISPAGIVTRLQMGETAIGVRFLQRHATVRLTFVPQRSAFRWASPPQSNFIDRHVFARLQSLRINPSELADDSTFLRRAYLDSIGTLPTVREAQAFLADSRPDRRAHLIDDLLQRPEFADFWALKWSDLLRNEEKVLDRKGVQVFHGWIRQKIADGTPLNEFARELILARGSTYGDPPSNFYRALRDPLARAEATAQVFLGLRLQCARCHNHPFDRWTQDDYYQLAAFFPRVRYRIIENNRRDSFDKHEFVGEQVVWIDRSGEVFHPRTNQRMAPQVLGDAGTRLADDADRLAALADWIARADNPYFARAQVNRVWGYLLGRALVEPNDDFRATNPPSHPELLDELARDFAAHQFDLRHLIHTILNSHTYQLAWQPNDSNRDDESNYSHALVRRLDAEVLLDALAQVMEVPVKFEGQPLGTRAVQLPGVQPRQRGARIGAGEKFLRAFGKPDRLLNCDCERSVDATIPQSLALLSGEPLLSLLRNPGNRSQRLLAARRTDSEIVSEFYLAALARTPTPSEARALADFLAKSKERQAAIEDMVWALLNTKEFLVRR